MATRLVLAANSNGRSGVIADHVGVSNAFASVPGFDPTTLWLHAPGKSLDAEGMVKPGEPIMPPPIGGATICVVTFPPDRIMQDPSFDPVEAGAEYASRIPGLADTFELDRPGMHRTPTTDVGFVLSGHPVCAFDDGEVQLNPGDVIMQQRTRHGWRNPTDEPARIAFVLMHDPK